MSLCACMGPQRGDPYCWCEMHRRGLTPTPPCQEEFNDVWRKALDKAFWARAQTQEVVTCLSCGSTRERYQQCCGH